MYGDYCWDSLSGGEGIDLTPSRRVPGWHSPVTVSMAYEGERTMVSHGHQAPPPEDAVPACPPPALAAVAALGPRGHAEGEHDWIARAAASGTRIFADVGWDETGRWDPADLDGLSHCSAFLPNAAEAVHYTRASTAREAARKLADLVPLVVVTLGAEGACAVDSATGETAEVPALDVETLDPTGAGDVFTAGFVTGSLAGWPLTDRLAFASLCAALSVQEFGGSLSAPGWIEIANWWAQAKAYAGEVPAGREAVTRFGFLEDLLPTATRPWPLRRAVPTIGFRSG
jgi:sugar/nucleoside kinase (ribokinase family)